MHFADAAHQDALTLRGHEDAHDLVVPPTRPHDAVRPAVLHAIHDIAALHEHFARDADHAVGRHDIHVVGRLGVYDLGPRVHTRAAGGDHHQQRKQALHRSLQIRGLHKTLATAGSFPAGNTGRDARHTVGRRYVWAPMDNLAHTLVGAALGRAIAGHRIRGAGLVGAVAGNAPDWTELLAAPGVGPPRSGLTYLEGHRG